MDFFEKIWEKFYAKKIKICLILFSFCSTKDINQNSSLFPYRDVYNTWRRLGNLPVEM